nr:hypothetical protein [Gordonia jinghuaiqii]
MTLTIVGATILIACIGFLTVGWWREGQWFWVAVGIAVVVVNIVLIAMQLRRRLGERVNDPGKPRRGLIDNFDDLDD